MYTASFCYNYLILLYQDIKHGVRSGVLYYMKNSIIRRYYGCLSTAAERVQKHRADSDNKVGAVKVHCKYKAKGQKAIIKPKSTYKKNTRTSNTFKAKSCRYCGKIHGKGQCLAYGKICSSCGKSNHFAAVCLTSKRVKAVHVENHSESIRILRVMSFS